MTPARHLLCYRCFYARRPPSYRVVWLFGEQAGTLTGCLTHCQKRSSSVGWALWKASSLKPCSFRGGRAFVYIFAITLLHSNHSRHHQIRFECVVEEPPSFEAKRLAERKESVRTCRDHAWTLYSDQSLLGSALGATAWISKSSTLGTARQLLTEDSPSDTRGKSNGCRHSPKRGFCCHGQLQGRRRECWWLTVTPSRAWPVRLWSCLIPS